MAESKIKAIDKKNAEVIIMEGATIKKVELYVSGSGYLRARVTLSDNTLRYATMGELVP